MIDKCEDIFSKIKKQDFYEVAKSIGELDSSVDVEYICKEYETGNGILLDTHEYWANRLKEGLGPDYSVYAKDYYLNEVFYCWKEYSRRYLLLMRKWLNEEDCPMKKSEIKSVLDLGCGLAFTTIGLKAIFEDAKVYGTNEPDTVQIRFDRMITESFDDVEILNGNFGLDDKVDLIFASEFFEHLEEPIKFTRELLEHYQPKYIVFANTFTKMSIGHFYHYKNDGVLVDRTEMPRLFTKTLKSYGYEKVPTSFFNNRPNIYKLVEKKGGLF